LANEANKKMSRGGKKITWSNIRDTFNYDSNVLKIRYTKLSNEAVNGLDHFRKMNTNYATVVFQKKTIEVMKQKGMCGFRNNITASMYSQNFRILLTYHNLIQQNKISYNQDDSLVIFNDLLKPKRMITNRSLYSSSFFKNTTFEVQDKRNSLQKLE
jgi:hypothetical protein